MLFVCHCINWANIKEYSHAVTKSKIKEYRNVEDGLTLYMSPCTFSRFHILMKGIINKGQ